MESENSKQCPECKGKAIFEVVDVEVGIMQIGPAQCSCGWIEDCPRKDDCLMGKCASFDYCKQGLKDNMEELKESLAVSTFGRSRGESFKENTCVACGNPATAFKDPLSRKEYSISGFCQECQDKTFGG